MNTIMKITFIHNQQTIETMEVNPNNYFLPKIGEYILLNNKRCRVIDVAHQYEIQNKTLLNYELVILLEVFDKE